MGNALVNLTVGHECGGVIPHYDMNTVEELRHLNGRTYIPPENAWVRTRDSLYIARVDAQRVALALLKVSWSFQGFLIGGEESGVAMKIFQAASGRLLLMLARLQEKVALLNLPTAQDQQKLLIAVNPVLRRLERGQTGPDVQLFRLLYQLNAVLRELGSPDNQAFVDEVVILAMTNEEFPEIVRRSIRNLKDSEVVEIELDLRSITLKVPSEFGVKQHFRVDWDDISDTTSRNRAHNTIAVKHTTIVLASVRSLVLCAMLLSCSDAGPLLELVGECGDLVYLD